MELKQMSAQHKCQKIEVEKRDSKLKGLSKWEDFRV